MAQITRKAAPWLTDKGLALITGWARRGLTDVQISHNMGISRSTLSIWRKNYPALDEVLETNKDIADIQVENSLFKRATGYDYDEETWFKDKETGEMVLAKKITKHVVPDTAAQIYWLKNRRPDLWRDRPATVANDAENTLINYFDALADAFRDKDNTQPTEDPGGDDNGT